MKKINEKDFLEDIEKTKLSMCIGKVGFSSPSKARSAIVRMRNRGDKNVRTYRCMFCKLFHIGHNTTKEFLKCLK